jgi:hypothetical protein
MTGPAVTPDAQVMAGPRTAGHASLRVNVGGAEVRHGCSAARLNMPARKAALMPDANAQSFAATYETGCSAARPPGRSGARGAAGAWRGL